LSQIRKNQLSFLREMKGWGKTVSKWSRRIHMKSSMERSSFCGATSLVTPRVIEALEGREEAMKARELAKLLGVTRQHVYKMAAEGLIPSFRVRSAVRFDPLLVAEWLRRKMPKPALGHERQRIAV
jgi:excisionase family DNA binding protein